MRTMNTMEMNLVAGGGVHVLACASSGDLGHPQTTCQTMPGFSIITHPSREEIIQSVVCRMTGECSDLEFPSGTTEKGGGDFLVSNLNDFTDYGPHAFNGLGNDYIIPVHADGTVLGDSSGGGGGDLGAGLTGDFGGGSGGGVGLRDSEFASVAMA